MMPPNQKSRDKNGEDEATDREPLDVSPLMQAMGADSMQVFTTTKRIKSFSEYLSGFADAPRQHARVAAEYVVDMIDSFGASQARSIEGMVTHHHLFDGNAATNRPAVFGQDRVIGEIVAILRAFARASRTDKLIVLHGPNGSAKSTIIASIMDGLERYSRTEPGCVHRYSWVFPAHDETTASVGFVPGSAHAPMDENLQETYAYLSAEDVASKVNCELKDLPILLLPRLQRERFFTEVCKGVRRRDGAAAAEELRARLFSPIWLNADLCPKCKGIFDALLAAYLGDLQKVLRHIQVERFYFSKRFRVGSVVVEPQIQNVDAWVRQVTADHSLQYLPSALLNLRIYEAGGDLVDANRGVLEYSDLLKRPREAFKYLLVTSEQGTLTLPGFIAQLDQVMLATVNELHLDEFKKIEINPDYVSFKARMEFVTVPYLLRVTDEERIYQEQMEPILRGVHVAPHTLELASLWAVLTRVRKPDPASYESPLSSLIARLDPLSKARLYSGLALGDRFRPEEARTLRAARSQIHSEYIDGDNYEGRFGASAREMKTVMQEAVHKSENNCVTPLEVFAALKELCTRKSVHLFLRINTEADGYRDVDAHIKAVEGEYLRLLTSEVKAAMGLVSDEECERLFNDYVEHAIAYTTARKVKNPITGSSDAPDTDLLRKIEKIFAIKESADSFRRNLGSRLGAYALEHPNTKLIYADVFPELMNAMREDVYSRKEDIVKRVERGILLHGHPEFADLPERDRERVETTLAELCNRFGYCQHCARVATAHLIKHELAR